MRLRTIAALAGAAAALAAPSSAAAFDTGPHADMTIDALRAEGFGADAAQVGRLGNWFVDFYSNAGEIPFSGHAPVLTVLAGGGFLAADHERWSRRLVDTAKASHMDSGTRVLLAGRRVSLRDPVAMEAEWRRLRLATRQLVLRARAHRSPLELLLAMGISTHPMQDFYSHTNWAETATEIDGPGWAALGQGSAPTFFDVPKAVRDGVRAYAGGAEGAPRTHGDWADSPRRTVAKDWPGRPGYPQAFMTGYFATRQWVRAIRGWLGDEALWRAAQRFAQHRAAIRREDEYARLISTYTGHQYGEGGPCRITCGDSSGWGGTRIGARQATKGYFARGQKSVLRRTFERLMPGLAVPAPRGGEADVPVESSRLLQATTRFVRLQVLSMRGIDLGDIGPDDADLYARATIAGQSFASPVIQAHDRFSFPAPYHAFTFLKAVRRGALRPEPVEDLTVRVRTSSARGAGTDDDVYLRIGGRRFKLDKRAYDDFERGDDDTYSVPIDEATREGLDRGQITRVQLEKSRDGLGGGWKLRGVELRVNGAVAYRRDGIEAWLEDSHRDWRAPDFVPQPALGATAPVWLDLREDDLGLAGDDDQGDVNPFDARDAISVAYPVGGVVERAVRGGHRLGGRLGIGGDLAELRYRIDTLETTLPSGGTDDPGGGGARADLVISQLGLTGFAVANQGAVASGPFTVRVGTDEYRFDGLAPGQTAARGYGNKCGGTITAVVDTGFEVPESDETNNVRTETFIC